MSVARVTLEETTGGLRIDGDDLDATLELQIQAASEAVLEYLKDAAEDFLDEQGDPIPEAVPARVKWATIALVGYWVRSPDANPDGEFDRGYLPAPVTALLYPLRTPSMA
mgnify:FL=1